MLTIATWNVENLFEPGVEGGPTSAAAFDAKLKALATTINDVGPDVLAVQEVGSAAALEALRERLAGDWTMEVSPDPDQRGIRVAFLSQLPVRSVQRVRAFPAGSGPVQLEDDGTTTTRMARGALHIRVTAGATEIDILTCHLKSKLLHFPGGGFSPRDEGERARYAGYALALRAAEAITIRDDASARLAGAGQRRPLVVLGDLNDEPLAATTQIVLGPGGSEFGTAGFAAADQGDGQRLWNIAPRIPEARRFSRRFGGRGELIDHILVSHALAQHVDAADTTSHVPSIGPDPAARRDAPGSDHAMVFARFDVG